MNVLLLHLDGKLPNLALMRLAAHHRAAGDAVVLRRADNKGSLRMSLQGHLGDPAWDRVYGSLIFERTRPLAERARTLYPGIVLGGTGWDFTTTLESIGVDADQQPDYTDYPRWRQSIGFTQRGCRLACEFCVVPRKEGRPRAASTIAEMWRGDPYPRESGAVRRRHVHRRARAPHLRLVADASLSGEAPEARPPARVPPRAVRAGWRASVSNSLHLDLSYPRHLSMFLASRGDERMMIVDFCTLEGGSRQEGEIELTPDEVRKVHAFLGEHLAWLDAPRLAAAPEAGEATSP